MEPGSRPLTEYFLSLDYLYLILLKTALFFAGFIFLLAVGKAIDAVWSWARRVVLD